MAGSEQVSWILRHVGPPPTIKGIVNVVELKQGTTTFGRGAGVDVYIDSLVLRNFISRRHAVITGEKSDAGQLQFILHNHGLNGTYVNDVRIGKEKRLFEGDKVIFGHTNGYKVKVGETALQPNSEFQFILECIRLNKSSVVPWKEQRQLKGCEPVSLPAVYTPRCNGYAVTDSSQEEVRLALQKKVKTEASPLSSYADSGTIATLKDDNQTPCTENCVPSGKTSPGKESGGLSEVFIANENKESKFMTLHKTFIESSLLNVAQGLSDKKLSERDCASEQTAIRVENFLEKQNRAPSVSSERSNSSNSDNSESISPIRKKRFCRFRSDKQELPREKTPSQGFKKSRDKLALSQRDRSRSPLERSEMDIRAGPKRDKHFEPDSQKMKKNSPLENSFRKSESPRHRLESPKRAAGRKSRSSSASSQTSCESEKSVYDEPPVLSPELDYVKTPSSDVRSPSPCIATDRASDYEFDVIDDIDRDYNVPPTPGRSLHELSPSPHCKEDNFPQSKLQEVSPQVKKWLFGDHNDEDFEDEEVTVDRSMKSSPHATAKHACGYSKVSDLRRADKERSKKEYKNSDILDLRGPYKDRTKKGFKEQSSRVHHTNSEAALATEQISRAGPNTSSNRSKAEEGTPREAEKGDCRKERTDKSKDKIANKNKEKKGDSDRKDVSERNFSKSEKNKSSEQLNRLQIQPFSKHSQSPDHRKSKSPSQRSSKDSLAHSEKDTSRGSNDVDAQKGIQAEGNIFEKFWAERHNKPDKGNSRKRQRGNSPDASSEEKSSRPNPKAARVDQASRKAHTESKENGLTKKCGSSDRQGDAGSKKDDKNTRNGKPTSEVYASLQNVAQGSNTATRVEDKKESLRFLATDGLSKCSGKSKDSDKHASSSKRIAKTITKKANDEEEESLFGRHLKSLGTVKARERPKKQKQAIESKETPVTFIKSSKDTLSKRPKDVRSRKTDTLHQETRGPDSVRNGKSLSAKRDSSSESQSSSPDFAFSGDEKSRSLRKVALRRPQPPQDNESRKNDSGRLSDRKSGSGQQPSKKGRRRKRKKKSSDDDDDDDDLDDDFFYEDGEDEDLPEGVTWYEEENCASSNCCRPAEKRVQWVCCDDCDKWYHTVCVGIAAFEELKDEDFHCGCV